MAEKNRPIPSFASWTDKGWNPAQFLDINQRAMDCWTRGMSALTEEMTHFIGARLEADMNAWSRLTSSRDPNEMLACQREYFQKTAADYFDEAGKLQRLTLSIANDGWSALQSESNKVAPAKRAAAE